MGLFKRKPLPWYPDIKALMGKIGIKATGEDIFMAQLEDINIRFVPPGGHIGYHWTGVVIDVGPAAEPWASQNHIKIGETGILVRTGLLEKSPKIIYRDKEWFIMRVPVAKITAVTEVIHEETLTNPKKAEQRARDNGKPLPPSSAFKPQK